MTLQELEQLSKAELKAKIKEVGISLHPATGEKKMVKALYEHYQPMEAAMDEIHEMAPKADIKAAIEASKDEPEIKSDRVEVFIQKGDGKRNQGDIPYGVNGRFGQIKRGVWAQVPRHVAEMLNGLGTRLPDMDTNKREYLEAKRFAIQIREIQG